MLIAVLLAQAPIDPGPKIDLLPVILTDMRANLLNPESARDLRVCEPQLAKDAWAVWYTYRAKNRMGGYTIGGFATLYKAGKVTGTLNLGESVLESTAKCPMVDPARLAEAMK